MAIIQINTKQNPVFLDTTWFSTPSTMALTYAAGAAAADQTLLIQAGKGGPVIFKANGAATGHLFEVQDSVANVLFDITDNSTHIIRSGMADGAAAVACITDTTTNWVTAGAKLLSVRNNAVEELNIDKVGNVTIVNTGATGFLVPAGQGMGLFTSTFSSGVKLEGAGVPGISIYNSNFGPFSDINLTNGDATHRWNGVFTNSVNGGSSATNTTNFTITTNVADGASSIGVVSNNTTALATAGAKLWKWQNGGVDKLALGIERVVGPGSASSFYFQALPALGGVGLLSGGGNSYVIADENNGTYLGYTATSYARATSAGLTINGGAPNASASAFMIVTSTTTTFTATGATALIVDGGAGFKEGFGAVSGTSSIYCNWHHRTVKAAATGTTVNRLVAANGNNTVDLPAAATLHTICGVALGSVASNGTVQVAYDGDVFVEYDGAVALGDVLVSSGTTAGRVVTNNTPAAGTVVGMALEAGGTTIVGQVRMQLKLG